MRAAKTAFVSGTAFLVAFCLGIFRDDDATYLFDRSTGHYSPIAGDVRLLYAAARHPIREV